MEMTNKLISKQERFMRTELIGHFTVFIEETDVMMHSTIYYN